MFKMLKDLFWKDQYVTAGEGNNRLDRDRYFLVLMILFAFQFVSSAGAAFIFPSYDGDLYEKVMDFWAILQSFYDVYFSVGPLLLVVNILIARRVVSAWWFYIPLALLNYLMQYGMLSMTFMLNPEGTPEQILILTITAVVVLWTVVHIGLLFLPKLSEVQPQHPLLKMNPAFAPEKQLNAVQFMWRTMILSAIVGAVSAVVVVMLLLSGAFGYSRFSSSQAGQLGWVMMVVVVVVGALGLWFTIKRIRNIGWNSWVVVFAWMLPLGAFLGLQGLFYQLDFLGSRTLYILFFLAIPWVRIAGLVLQVSMICRPAFLSEKPAISSNDSSQV